MKHTMKRLLAVALILAALGAYLIPGAAAADTLTERQRALQETAMAFYLTNPYMQYDSALLTNLGKWDGGTMREENYITPEDGTADHTLYTVCSSFTWEIYYNTFGYILMDDPLNCTTTKLTEECPKELIVFQQSNTGLTGEERIAKMNEAKAILQPGDLVVCMKEGSGHAMFYAGDVDGDGIGDVIHSAGNKYDISTGRDAKEASGNIRKDKSEDYFFSEKGGYYFASPKIDTYTLIRPLLVSESQYPLTTAAKARLQYPRIKTERTVSTGAFGSATTGDTLTYTIKITNNSKNDYGTLPVTETVPAGTELVGSSVKDSGKESGGKISWTVSVPAGKSVTLSYNVKVTAKRGEAIVAKDGSVGGVPSNTLTTYISGKAVDAKALADKGYRSAVAAQKPAGSKFANAVYQEALGIDLQLPDIKDILNNMTTKEKMTACTMNKWNKEQTGVYQTVKTMMIPKWFGGTSIFTETCKDRVMECRTQDLQAGDIILACDVPFTSTSQIAMVHIGTELVALDGNKIATVNENDVIKLLSKGFFVALRPSLAYDDVAAEAKYVPSAKLPFTDVKEGDWYYEFVKELYEKKIVAGMTDTTFVPNGKLTWGQALKLIVCGLGKGEQATTGSHWASGYLTFAKNQKWLDKDVDLNGAISRLQFCQVAAKAKDLTAQPASNPFKDCADKDVLALVNAGIINGMSADTFAPDSTLTRAQISKIISGLIK